VKLVLLLLLVSCAPKPLALPAGHPAHPSAPTGRPPPALRAGVVETPPPAPPTKHQH
jgi:hypothetical protein